MSTEIIIQIGETISTVIIAIIVAYIAWRQHKLDQQKFRFELFDRRMRAYEAVKKVLGITVREGRFPEYELNDFWKAGAEVDFIFESDIGCYFDEIYKKGVNLNFFDKRIELEKGLNRDEAVENRRKIFEWFIEQLKCQPDKFKKYLSIKA